ncbi:MAG TPA: response regulator transcription factor [Thermodesulfovibrionales bacterium]|jgi:phosphate regulon transcriptional regulator PhoB|nr:response regulator transcription factor [Thermodesulfovibrionales bacterium]
MSRQDAQKILAVDDEQDIIELLAYNLSIDGFEVTTAADGEEALKKIRAMSFDLVILDLMMPGIHGMDLCRILRNDPKTKNLPIIMLTAKTEEVDRVLGLEMGADDYVTKPFSPRELTARIKAVLRRSTRNVPESRYITIGNLTINTETYSVAKDNVPLNLSPTEFRLLLYLVERRGKIFNREQLLNAVWKDEGYVEPRTVDVHVSRIRMQIEEDPANPLYIKTRRGHGYYFDNTVPEGK